MLNVTRLATLLFLLLINGHAGLSRAQSTSALSAPKRINKAIELLERGQPIYYTQVNGGGYEGAGADLG